jgi:hypothetical protein
MYLNFDWSEFNILMMGIILHTLLKARVSLINWYLMTVPMGYIFVIIGRSELLQNIQLVTNIPVLNKDKR